MSVSVSIACQTMLRVKDPAKSLHFYRDLLGMTLLAESHYSDFSLYFLACANQNPVLAEALAANTLPKTDSPEAKVSVSACPSVSGQVV
jgi:catechol 2,3-dioxygenase-like lactoylglutathione lyase family enzyme